VKIYVTVFWFIAPCVVENRRFGGPWRCRQQDPSKCWFSTTRLQASQLRGSSFLINNKFGLCLFRFRILVGLLWRVIGPSQDLCLHRTAQHRKNADIHPCLERDSNPRSQCSSGRKQYVPQTARLLGPAILKSVYLLLGLKCTYHKICRGSFSVLVIQTGEKEQQIT
jgi:hypothetical protein